MRENSRTEKRQTKMGGGAFVKHYMQPAFLICVAVLVIAGSSMSIAIKSFGVYLKKEPFPLKKSLDFLDENELVPYRVVSKEKIENNEIVEALGTEDYIQWILEDLDAPADSAVRYCSLFITYYGLPDPRVVHVPDECYMGVGYQRLGSSSVSLEVNKDGIDKEISARYIVFAGADSDYRQDSAEFQVLYLFSVNGRYVASREEARVVLNKNLFGKYSYFSKVEWQFFYAMSGAGGRQGNIRVYPDKEEAVVASQKLLGVILPILEKEHWPVWKGGRAVNDE